MVVVSWLVSVWICMARLLCVCGWLSRVCLLVCRLCSVCLVFFGVLFVFNVLVMVVIICVVLWWKIVCRVGLVCSLVSVVSFSWICLVSFSNILNVFMVWLWV